MSEGVAYKIYYFYNNEMKISKGVDLSAYPLGAILGQNLMRQLLYRLVCHM